METVTIETEKAKKILQQLQDEAARGLENAIGRTTKVAWAYNQVGALEFAQEMGILWTIVNKVDKRNHEKNKFSA